MKFMLISLALFSLSACQSAALIVDGTPYPEVPINSRLILNQELEILPDQVAVYLQYGKVVSARDVSLYYPNCKFEIKTIENKARKVMPDEFVISRFFLDSNRVSSGFIQLASLITVSSGGATAEIYSTEMFLQSTKQPDVFRLTCEHWEDPADGAYLSLTQIKQALGQVMEIKSD